MKPINVLRTLLVSAVVLAIGAGACDVLFPNAVPEQSREIFKALLSSRQLPSGSIPIVASISYELLLLASVFGMMIQKRWGMPLGMVVTGLTMVQALLLGPHAYSGLAFMLSYASKVAWGGALGVAFCLRQFERHPNHDRA